MTTPRVKPSLESRSGYRWAVMTTAFLGVFAAIGLARFGYGAILPSMQKSLGLSGAEAGSLASWNLGAYTTMALVGGLLAAKFGARLIISIGLFVSAVALLLTGFASSLAMASAARAVTGLGNGMVMAPSLALMASWFRARQLGLASAIVASGGALGLVVAGPITPLVIRWGGENGWRWAWFFFAAVAAVMGLIAALFLRNRPRPPIASKTSGEQHPPASRSGYDAASSRPKTRFFGGFGSVVRSRFAWHLGLVYALYGFGFIIFVTFFQRRLTGDLGYSDSLAGFLFLIMGMAGLVFGVSYGVASDRVGRGRALAATLILEAAVAVVFHLGPGVATLTIAVIVFGSGAYCVPGLIGAACGEHFGGKMASVSLGFLTLFIGVGQATGPYLAGLLADASGSYAASFLLAAAVLFAGGVIALLLDVPRMRQAGVRRSQMSK